MEKERIDAEAQAAERAEQERLERLRAEANEVVEKSLRGSLAALRDGDEAAARRALDAAVKAAGDDAELVSRCGRWRLLVNYAKELETFRRRASESAAEGREYVIGGRTIAIVELNPQTYAFKENGQTFRGARSDLPRAIDRAILREWFAGDGRAANHIFLGIDRLLDPQPDLQRVREEWETALRGEPATQGLMPLLDDPAIADR
jgi:hypothetical protein